MPLIVITADRPPELRGRGAGPDDRPAEAVRRRGALVLRAGRRAADDTGLLHYRSTAVRAVAEARGRPPGPGAPERPAHRAARARSRPRATVTATEPRSRARGAGGRPLTAVAAARLEADAGAGRRRSPSSLTECRRGVILAGRSRDPELAEPVGGAGARLRLSRSWPSRPRSCAAAPHDLRAGRRRPTTWSSATCPSALAPELVIRVGDMVTSKAVRTWLGGHRGCRQVVIDPDGAWNEPTVDAPS